MRGTLSKAAAEMSGRKEHVSQLSRQIEERQARLEKARSKLAAQERALERSTTHMGNLEAAAKQMEELNEQESGRVKATEKELTILKEKMFSEG